MGRLSGKVALITGAAGGQGAAAARRFVDEGARVVVADVRDDDGKALADELGAHYLHLDVSEEDGWTAAVAEVSEVYGPPNVLVNNAGILHFALLQDTTLADYLRVIQVNQVGTFLGMRAVVPGMVEAGGGSIINVSSVEGLRAAPAADRLHGEQVRDPRHDQGRGAGAGQQGSPGELRAPGRDRDRTCCRPRSAGSRSTSPIAGKRVPLGRVGQPGEIADLVVFLASDESSYCTGAEFVADGGVTAAHSLSSFG